MTKNIIYAGLLGSMFATSAIAQTKASEMNLEDLTKLEDCMTEAINAIDIPGTQRYYDPDDQGHKKYLDSENIFAGISAFIDPTGTHIGLESNSVAFFVKYYDEENGDPIDYARQLEFWFHNGEVYNTNHGHTVSYDPNDIISSFDAPPRETSAYEDAAADWVTNTANTLGLHFTICMNFEPYEADGFLQAPREIVPPVFPVPEG